MRKIFLTLVLASLGLAYAQLDRELSYDVDKFKGTVTSTVRYSVLTPEDIKVGNELRAIDCSFALDYGFEGLNYLDTSNRRQNVLGFTFYQKIDSYARNKFDPIPENAEMILLIDGKRVKLTAYDVENGKSSGSCYNKNLLGTSNYTSYHAIASYDADFNLEEFSSANSVEFKVYTEGNGYSGTIPKSVRDNLVKLWKEDLSSLLSK